MEVLISAMGSRGDVQPVIALAVELQTLGHAVRLCVPPDYKPWVESFGLTCIPVGMEAKKSLAGDPASKPVKPSKEVLRQISGHIIRGQFQTLTEVARGCDLIVGVGAFQIATRSIAEALGIPYVFAAHCPATLPSPDHPPPKMFTHHSQILPTVANRFLWMTDARSWNFLFRTALNEEREKVGLRPIKSVRRHMFTGRPWLAVDPALAPAAPTADLQIVQTGAWFLADPTPLPAELENFLANGEPPVYFGFGSMRSSAQTSRHLIEAARALGLRSIISQGWGNLSPIDGGSDCISIGDVDHEKLFPRVAAVVHHGGAGTTSATARAGKAQAVVPHIYDQYYWARRVKKLGAGVAGPNHERLTCKRMVTALRQCLRPEVKARAQALSSRVELHGARIAAERLVSEFG